MQRASTRSSRKRRGRYEPPTRPETASRSASSTLLICRLTTSNSPSRSRRSRITRSSTCRSTSATSSLSSPSWRSARVAATSVDVHLLAVSDEVELQLLDERTVASKGRVDLLIGCGDLPADYLDALSTLYAAPLLFVRGNHDLPGRLGDYPPAAEIDGRVVREKG